MHQSPGIYGLENIIEEEQKHCEIQTIRKYATKYPILEMVT